MSVPAFRRIMGECSSKEWVARIPGYEDDAGGSLWVLLKVRKITDTDQDEPEVLFFAELFECFTDIDWFDRTLCPLELLVEQFFTGKRGFWTKEGDNPLVLMHAAVQEVAVSF